jgi:hypothetical protein
MKKKQSILSAAMLISALFSLKGSQDKNSIVRGFSRNIGQARQRGKAKRKLRLHQEKNRKVVETYLCRKIKNNFTHRHYGQLFLLKGKNQIAVLRKDFQQEKEKIFKELTFVMTK